MHARRFVQQLFDLRLTTSGYIPGGPVEGGGGFDWHVSFRMYPCCGCLRGADNKISAIYAYKFTHARTPTHVCIHIYHTSLSVRTHARTHAHTHTHTPIIHTYTYYMHTQARMRAHTHPLYTHMHIQTHMHTHQSMYTHNTCAQPHIQTYTQTHD